MIRIIKDWLTRPRWQALFVLPQVLISPQFALLACFAGPNAVLMDALNGTLKTMRTLPESLRVQSNAYWLLAVILIPAASALLCNVLDSTGWGLIFGFNAGPVWMLCRFPLALGSAGLLYLLLGMSMFGAASGGYNVAKNLLNFTAVLALGLAVLGIDYLGSRQPEPPLLFAVGLLSMGVPVSAVRRHWIYAQLFVPKNDPHAEQESVREASLLERLYRSGFTAMLCTRFPIGLGMGILLGINLTIVQIFMFYNTKKEIDFNNAFHTNNVILLIAVQIALQAWWPSLRSLRCLPLDANALTLRLLGASMACSMGCALGYSVASFPEDLTTAGGLMLSTAMLIWLAVWYVPLALRWPLMAPVYTLLPIIFALNLFITLSSDYGTPARTAVLLGMNLFLILLLPLAFLWARSELRKGRDNYRLAKWQRLIARKG